MTALVPVVASRLAGANTATAGVTTTAADTFPAGPNTYLRIRNASGTPATVTVTPVAGSGPQGTTIAPFALAPVVPITTGDVMYGPFPQNPFGDSSGNVNFAVSTPGATVTASAYVLPGA
jgi:hypothetical protein